MHKILKLLGKHWPLFTITLTAAVLRVINLEELFYFTYDEAIPAFVGRRLLLWNHLPLIGGVTPFGFHLAPYFYWFLSGLLILGKLNPIIWGYTSALIAAGTTLLIYIVGKKFANSKVGLTASIFWCFSYLANIYDRHLWALYWGPLLSLIVLFSLYRIIKKNDNFLLVLAPALAFGVSADPSNIVFILVTVVVWFIYKLHINKKFFLAVLIFFISFAPLALFDLRHNLGNTRPIFEFFKQERNNIGFNVQDLIDNSLLFPRAFSRLVYTFGDNQIAKQYSYCESFVKEKFSKVPFYVLLFSSTIIIGFILWSFKNKNSHPGWFLVSLLLIVYYLGIQVYGTVFRADTFEHYITGSFAVLILIFAKIVSVLPKKIWILTISVFVIFNLYKLSQAKNSMGLKIKREAIEYSMSQVSTEPFSLDSLSTCWKWNGYRYLFTVFGKEPVKSYVDPNLAYLYGTTEVWPNHPPLVVSFVVHDFAPETEEFYKRYVLLKSHETSSRLFGNIEVIIMDNSTNWFR